ncbi:MAG: glycosyltransferase family 2 protein [Acidimicrobiia bacterium]
MAEGTTDDPLPAAEDDAVPAWAAVVITFESGDLLLGAVDSLLADASAGVPEIVVVDNGSTDGSVARLRASRPSVRVVEPDRNLGYAAGANAGIVYTRAPVVVVCNADLVARAGTAATVLERFASEPGIAAVGPRVVDVHGVTYPSARAQPAIADAVGHALLGAWRPDNRFTRRYHQRGIDPSTGRDVDWVSGAAIWLRRSALDSIGGWDEAYFMYVEDVDLCWRLRRAGWRVAYEPRGLVTHVQGASTALRPLRMIVEHHRSWYRFADRRWEGPRRLLLVPVAAFLALRAALLVVLEALPVAARRRRAAR